MVRIGADENQHGWIREADDSEEEEAEPEEKQAPETDEVLEIKDYYRVWVKSPDDVPDERTALYDQDGGPGGNHYYYEVPFDTSTTIELADGDDLDTAVTKAMREKAAKEYPSRDDLVAVGAPDKDLTLVDKARTQVENGMPLFGRDLKKSNPSILRNVGSALTLLHLYKVLYDEGAQYEAFLNQLQKELGRRGIYSFEKVAKARRYIDHPSEAPPDAQVQEGPQGGLWFDTEEVGGGNESEDDLDDADASVGDMVDSLPVEEWPEEHMVLGEDDLRREMEAMWSRADDEHATHFLNEFEGFRNKTTRSAYRSNHGDIVLRPGADEETIAHESGHAFIESYDYTVNQAGNIFPHFFAGEVPDVEFGRPVVEIAEELAQQRLENDRLPDDAIEETKEALEQVRERFGDRELKRYDMYLKLDRESEEGIPDDITGLVQTINFAWEKQMQAKQSDEMDVDNYTIGKAYSATNAHETWALTHESLQGDVADPRAMENLYLRQEELLDAYTNVFEPADVQKSMMNHLFREFGPNKVWDELPYPDAEGVLAE